MEKLTSKRYSLWGISSYAVGGLQFSEFKLGVTHAASGVAMLFYQLLCFPPLNRKLTSLLLYRIILFLLIPTMGFYPYACNSFLENVPLLWTGAIVFICLQRIFYTTCYATGDIMLNNSSSPANVGGINGLNASLSSLMRVIGPVVAGSLYSTTAYSGNSFPMNYSFTFSLIALFCLLNFFSSLFISKEVNFRIHNAELPKESSQK